MSHGGYVLAPGAGRSLDMGPFRMSVKAEGSGAGGPSFSLLEADEPPGFGPPMHVHDDAGEAFYVLAGEYLVFIDGREHHCPAGSFVFVPPGVEHGFRVGSVQSRKLNVYVPAAMVGYFDELAAAQAASATPDDDALTALAARYSMRVVGPVPDGYV
jgi:quercetin dioxygenase-like cupin family protein